MNFQWMSRGSILLSSHQMLPFLLLFEHNMTDSTKFQLKLIQLCEICCYLHLGWQHTNNKDVWMLSVLPVRNKPEQVIPYLVEKSAEGPAAVHSSVVHSMCWSTKGKCKGFREIVTWQKNYTCWTLKRRYLWMNKEWKWARKVNQMKISHGKYIIPLVYTKEMKI